MSGNYRHLFEKTLLVTAFWSHYILRFQRNNRALILASQRASPFLPPSLVTTQVHLIGNKCSSKENVSASGCPQPIASHNSCAKGSKNCMSFMLYEKGCAAKATESHHLLAGKCIRAWDTSKGKAEDDIMLKATCLANGTLSVQEFAKAKDCSGKSEAHIWAMIGDGGGVLRIERQ